jgi:hypothetical protein
MRFVTAVRPPSKAGTSLHRAHACGGWARRRACRAWRSGGSGSVAQPEAASLSARRLQPPSGAPSGTSGHARGAPRRSVCGVRPAGSCRIFRAVASASVSSFSSPPATITTPPSVRTGCPANPALERAKPETCGCGQSRWISPSTSGELFTSPRPICTTKPPGSPGAGETGNVDNAIDWPPPTALFSQFCETICGGPDEPIFAIEFCRESQGESDQHRKCAFYSERP